MHESGIEEQPIRQNINHNKDKEEVESIAHLLGIDTEPQAQCIVSIDSPNHSR